VKFGTGITISISTHFTRNNVCKSKITHMTKLVIYIPTAFVFQITTF
jgi:hypothetical protein